MRGGFGAGLLLVTFTIVFGVILMVQPGAGALAVAWMIAWYAIFFGCLTRWPFASRRPRQSWTRSATSVVLVRA